MLHWGKGRRGRWTALLDPGESTEDALTTGKALFSSCPLLALDDQPQNTEPQETRQRNFYCSQQCLFLAEEIQVVPLGLDTRVTSHHRRYAAALGCWVGCNFCRSLSHFSSMHMHLSGCLQPALWNIFFFFNPPDFPLVGKTDLAELSFSWFTRINGYCFCCRTFHSSPSSRSCL